MSFTELANLGASKAEESVATIERLLAEQKEAREMKRKLAKEVKNERRKRTRLNNRARRLSTTELLQVVAMRERDAVGRAVAEGATGTDVDGAGQTDEQRVEDPPQTSPDFADGDARGDGDQR